jgi:PII-like signaling protein
MTQTVQRQKIEILVDRPLLPRIVAAAKTVGVGGYTILPALSGAGAHGTWDDDQLSGAQAKVVFVTVTSAKKAESLIDALTPLLESHGLMLLSSTVDVVRGAKF